MSVGGQRVALETRPLELLHELLLRAGQAVTKDELLDAVWPDVSVVQGSVSTAINKIRIALGDERRDQPIIETVPRVGYRLAAGGRCGDSSPHPARPCRSLRRLPDPRRRISLVMRRAPGTDG